MSVANGPPPSPTVRLEIADHVAVVTLARPSVLNAMNREGKRRLAEIWRLLSDDEDVRAIVVTGEGQRAFCAGSDVKEIRATGSSATTDEVINALPNSGPIQLRQPVIAAVNGLCLGFGLTLALQCDLRLASTDAAFGLPETKQGMISALSAVMLPHAVPVAAAMELLLLGETITAERAERIGLVSRVVASGAALSEARVWAERLATYDPIGVVETKRLMQLWQQGLRDASLAAIGQARARVEATLPQPDGRGEAQ